MAYSVRITPKARRSILENAQWWASNRSAKQAHRWYGGILDTIKSLAEDADRFGLAPESDQFSYAIRERYFGLSSRPTHRIVFTISANIAEVIAVRHASQDNLSAEEL